MKKEFDALMAFMCDHYNVTVEEVTGRSRERKIVMIRALLIHKFKKMNYNSVRWTEIAEWLNRDHSTVMHLYENVENDVYRIFRDLPDCINYSIPGTYNYIYIN